MRFLSPVVVSFGDEDYFLDQDLASFRKQPDRSVVLTEGDEFKKDHELVSLCQTHTSEAKPRVVIVDNAQDLKPEKAMKAYLEGLSAKDLYVVLALVFRTPKLPVFWSKLADKVTIFERKKLKTYETNNEVVKWIETEIKVQGLKGDSRIANVIYMGTGPDLYRASNEIQKLKMLVGSGGTITIEHLQSILTIGSTVDVWQVVDSAANKDSKKAANLMSSLYKHSSEDPSILLAYSLMKQAERMYIACSMLSKGASEEDIAARVAMHPWRCKTFFMPMVRKHTTGSLSRTMQDLCKLDVEIKRTSHSKRTLIELAVLRFAS
jgi:DNA polymerase III delta subunit